MRTTFLRSLLLLVTLSSIPTAGQAQDRSALLAEKSALTTEKAAINARLPLERQVRDSTAAIVTADNARIRVINSRVRVIDSLLKLPAPTPTPAPVPTPTPAPAPSPAPPPSSVTTHEPTGFTLITERDFRAIAEAGWYYVPTEARFTIENVAGPRGDGKVGQAFFQAGFPGNGTAPIKTEKNLGGDYHQLYVGMWFRLSPNFEGNLSSINKMLFIWTDGHPAVFLTAYGQGANALYLNLNLQENVGGAVGLQTNTVITRGDWHFIELVLVANTVGQKNGSAKVFMDGRQIGNFTNIGPARDRSNRWETVSWNPTWGGLGNASRAAMYQQIDYIRVSGAP